MSEHNLKEFKELFKKALKEDEFFRIQIRDIMEEEIHEAFEFKTYEEDLRFDVDGQSENVEFVKEVELNPIYNSGDNCYKKISKMSHLNSYIDQLVNLTLKEYKSKHINKKETSVKNLKEYYKQEIERRYNESFTIENMYEISKELNHKLKLTGLDNLYDAIEKVLK